MDKITDIYEGPYMRKEKAKINRAVLKKQRMFEAVDFPGKDAALKEIKKQYKEAYTALINGASDKPKEVKPEAAKKKAAKKTAKKKAVKKNVKPDTDDLV